VTLSRKLRSGSCVYGFLPCEGALNLEAMAQSLGQSPIQAVIDRRIPEEKLQAGGQTLIDSRAGPPAAAKLPPLQLLLFPGSHLGAQRVHTARDIPGAGYRENLINISTWVVP